MSEPEVALGQVRRGRLAYQKRDTLWVVAEMAGPYVREDGYQNLTGITMATLRTWPCVGVETPHGRVMVGERRQNPGSVGGVYEVTRVTDGDMVELHGVGFTSSVVGPAAGFARWPLVTGSSHDPREQGPGIATLRQPPPPPSLPDVVYTWEAWALP